MSEQTPLLRVLSGHPAPEELAALTVVVAALSQRRPRRRPAVVGGWADRARLLGAPPRPGAGAWSASGRPA